MSATGRKRTSTECQYDGATSPITKPINGIFAAEGENPRMNRTQISKRWCAFAIVMLALVLPFETKELFGKLSLYDATRYAVDTVAVIGVAGYAFNVRTGPEVMWRIFAPIFILFSVTIATSGLPRLLVAPVRSTMSLLAISSALSIGAAIIGFMSLALLRHGGWLDTDRAG